MIEKYNQIFNQYKDFIENNSKFTPRVVKYNTNTSTYFPLITCVLSNTVSTNSCTLDKIENYEQQYYTINIYTQDKVITEEEETEEGETTEVNTRYASQIINDELTSLTIQFFEKINMKRTQCTFLPNLDTSVIRRSLMFQCMVGNVRGNIIRR